MASFIDSKGVTHTLRLNGASVRMLLTEHKFDGAMIATAKDPIKTMVEMLENPMRACALAFAISGEDDEIKFLEAIEDGTVLEAVSYAFMETVIDFFLQSKSKILKAALAKQKQANELASQKLLTTIESQTSEQWLNATLKHFGNGSMEHVDMSDANQTT